MGARVVVPLVIAKTADGTDLYLYEGAPVPEGLADGEVERLAEYIAEDVVESAFPEGKPSAEWKVEQLKAYAEANSIDLGDAKKKDELLAVLVPTE